MWEVFRFESRHQSRSPLFLAVAVVFFLLGFLVTASESVSVGGLGDNLNLNASFAIIQIQFVLTVIGIFAAVAFVANAITRDLELKTAEIFFTTTLRERDYVLGRFLGGWLFATLAVAAGLLGILVGTFMPWLDPDRLGPFTIGPYLFAFRAVLLPNLFVVCALFFAVAAWSRSIMAAYVAALGLIVAVVVLIAVTDPEKTRLVALADPFGLAAFGELTRYWTVYDRNVRVPELAGVLLYNRLIWLGVGLLALLVTVATFRFRLQGGWRWPRWRRRGAEKPAEAPPVLAAVPVRLGRGWRADLTRLASQLRMDVRSIVRSKPFYVLLAFGMFNVIGSFLGTIGELYGTPVLPLTGTMVGAVEGSFMFVVLIIIIYYSGELVHSERSAGLAEIVDATAYPPWIMAVAKVGALWFVITALLIVVMLTAIVVQTVNDYYRYQLDVYFVGLFGMIGFWYYLWCIPAVLVQVLSPGKFVGMLVFLLVFLALQTLPSIGFEHHLYLFSGPEAPYSDMNGYGHFVQPMVSFGLYWLCFALLLLIVAHVLFPRGVSAGWRDRLAVARSRLSPGLGAASALLTVAFASLGGWIYYNTNVLNEYLTEDDREQAQADYEKQYKRFAARRMPAVIDIDAGVHLFPAQRRLESQGTAVLENVHPEPLDELHFTLAPELSVNALEVPGAALEAADQRLGYYRYRLDEPMRPGEQRRLRWDLTWSNPGFENSGSTTRLVYNGTFVDNTEIMPLLGYSYERELTDNNVRRRFGLPPVVRLPELGDPDWLDVNQLQVSRRSGFRTHISTSADQIAIAPGYLEREWLEDGRRHFVYAMDQPIWPFVSFSSARYAVTRDRWQNVALEVYHHPEHDYNVEAMLRASRESLEYFSRVFSPYQYRQFRIIEFPGYETFAQSFPNTIPFSEAIGFVADLRDEEHIDYVFYVTAHELAHQWWAHQVIGAYMQGATVIVETLAQYSALMVQEKAFGPHQMRRFLKYELDNYLRSRGGEIIEELPLLYVENQGYVHYRKGSLVMYALKDYLGEAAVNRALRRFLDRYAFQGPPFPTARDLVAEFRAEASSAQQPLITDLFERITLFDLKVTGARVRPVGDEFEVEVTIVARKLYADGSGREEEAPLDYPLDVGLFPAHPSDGLPDQLPEPIGLEKRRIVSGEQVVTFRVPERPALVGIDPYNKMIDRNPDDNLLRL